MKVNSKNRARLQANPRLGEISERCLKFSVMKHHIEVVISDSEWVDILTVHSETGSAIGSSVPLENIPELISELQKILNDKRNVERGEEKSCPHCGSKKGGFIDSNHYKRCKQCYKLAGVFF